MQRPQIVVPLHWRSEYALNTVAGDCCNDSLSTIVLKWIAAGNPLSVATARFTLECTNKFHGPFCMDAVTGILKDKKDVIACVKLVAGDDERLSKDDELAGWAKIMVRSNRHAHVLQAIEEVPSARAAIGRGLADIWKQIANLQLYAGALRWECAALGGKEAAWLFETRLRQPWPARQREPPSIFAEAESLRELGRMALYFEKRADARVLPEYAARRIIAAVKGLMWGEERRPPLPNELITTILYHAGFGSFE